MVLRRLKWISVSLKLALAENGWILRFPWCFRGENLLGKASRQSTSLCFRYESHGGHRAHEQARIETKATNGSGRKASLYEELGVRHRTFHEIDGACHSLTAARNSKPLIHGNSTWNVEEPK
jgi:hypothetical protein